MLTRLRAAANDDQGVTLVELLVVILLMGVIGGYGTMSMVKGMKLSASTQSRFDALADLQRSVDRMTRELRAASPAQTGGVPVVVSAPDRAVVDVWQDDFSSRLRFTYKYCSTRQVILVRREAPAPAGIPADIDCSTATDGILIERVVNPVGTPVFKYFNASDVETTTAAQVRKIEVTVTRSMPNQPDTIQVTTMVRLRNVR